MERPEVGGQECERKGQEDGLMGAHKLVKRWCKREAEEGPTLHPSFWWKHLNSARHKAPWRDWREKNTRNTKANAVTIPDAGEHRQWLG